MRNFKVGSGGRVTLGGGSLALKAGWPWGASQPFPYKQFGYFCLAYQGQIDTYGACANAGIGRNNIEVRGKFVQNGLRRCFSVPDIKKGRRNSYFKITFASILNREGQVLARSTGITFSYKRSAKDGSGERVTLLPGTTLLHINRP